MIYTSKDVARETCMTTEGLRFYEKQGLIKVNKNEKNGYRAYEIMQVPLIRAAKILNTYGISLSEVSGFFQRDDSSLPELCDSMEERQSALRQELWWKTRVLERLEYQTNQVRRAHTDPDGVWFEILPAIAHLEYYGASRLRRNRELQKTVEKWITLMPVVYPMPILLEKDLEDPTAYCPAGFSCNAEDLTQLELPVNRFVRIVLARQYLCCICPQDECARINPSLPLAPLRETAARMNLHCIGDVFFMSFAVTMPEKDRTRLYYQVMMPVAPGK